MKMNKIDLSRIRTDEKFMEKFQVQGDFSLLGNGEYNINYLFFSGSYKKKLVLRIATSSQMNLNNQISYEYKTLELLEDTGKTPGVLYLDDSRQLIPFGFLVMEYLPGRPLDYKKDLVLAAEALASIHNKKVASDSHLLRPENPIRAIYDESLSMFSKYKSSIYRDEEISSIIEELLKKGLNIQTEDIGTRTVINTELNSGNFLINGPDGPNYVIDWEKPLYGYPAQDLGHFLTPTTTFWKTDVILSREEVEFFIGKYCDFSREYKDPKKLLKSVRDYISINCLRGITWCSMAYVEYQDPNKLISNDFTYEKIKAYLSKDFLRMIGREYLNEY